jgi:hypothetical protein
MTDLVITTSANSNQGGNRIMDVAERIQVALDLESSIRDQNQRLTKLLTNSTEPDVFELLNRLNLALFDAKVFIEEYRNQISQRGI